MFEMGPVCRDPLRITGEPIFAFGSYPLCTSGALGGQKRAPELAALHRASVLLGLLGIVSVRFPEILGNGRDLSRLLFDDQAGTRLLLACCS